MTSKPSCLILCSAEKEGVSAQSFVHAFTLTNSAFILHIATPQGQPIEFVHVNETNRKWIADFKSKSYAQTIKMETIDPTRYSALLIPSCPGAMYDLAKHDTVMHILRSFASDKKPICAIGDGMAALAAGKYENNEWCFKGYSLTGPSVSNLVQRKDFATLPLIFEDFAKDNLASYSASTMDKVHIVIDHHLITGQNEQSTLTAVQNLILLCNGH